MGFLRFGGCDREAFFPAPQFWRLWNLRVLSRNFCTFSRPAMKELSSGQNLMAEEIFRVGQRPATLAPFAMNISQTKAWWLKHFGIPIGAVLLLAGGAQEYRGQG